MKTKGDGRTVMTNIDPQQESNTVMCKALIVTEIYVEKLSAKIKKMRHSAHSVFFKVTAV